MHTLSNMHNTHTDALCKYPGFEVDVSSNKALAASLNRCVDPSDPLVNKLLRALATSAMAEVWCVAKARLFWASRTGELEAVGVVS